MYVYVIILRYWIQKTENNIDNQNHTPSDYAIKVTGLPWYTVEEFTNHIEKNINGVRVEYVNPVYSIDKFIKN